jgi:ArsR family transcriptional regulator, arsenate/arsenite/antimonite-responsive transcriptional repressor
MKTFVAVVKALSDTNRIRALLALRKGELCVCQIIELLGLAPSTVSKHMSVLKHAGLVESRKEERWMYYRLPKQDIMNAQRWMSDTIPNDPVVSEDDKKLQKIKRTAPDVLCKKHRNGKC